MGYKRFTLIFLCLVFLVSLYRLILYAKISQLAFLSGSLWIRELAAFTPALACVTARSETTTHNPPNSTPYMTICDLSGLSTTKKDTQKTHFTTRITNRAQNTNNQNYRGAIEKTA
jgi:hypothetical protein